MGRGVQAGGAIALFKSIFAKQFVYYISALIMSYLLLAGTMSMAVNNFVIRERERMLTEQGRRISDIYIMHLFGGIGIIQAQRSLINELSVLHDYLNASFIFINEDFMILQGTVNIYPFLNTTLDIEELQPLLYGEMVTHRGWLGDVFPERVLTVGYPLVINGSVAGAVLLSSPMQELENSIEHMLRLIFLCLVFALVPASALIFFFSRTISKPVREVNEAVQVIASGDFQQRVEVQSNDEIGQLAACVNNMAESLYEQDKLRHDFITNISHDLRSPLTSIRGFIQAILDSTIPPEKQDHYLRIVMEETERLSKLTHEIIALNKVQIREIALDKKEFNINDLIRKTIMMFEACVIEKNIKLEVSFADKEGYVWADYEKIHRVLYNLLDNAIKFTPQDGEVSIDTSLVDKAKKVALSVRDTGCGISEENQKRIFERFYKADVSRGIDRKGSGLGLSIVVAFIKAHGENITVHSKEGEGSHFTFTLPLAIDERKKK